MLEAQMSADLESLVRELDDSWEERLLETLPFPVAYPLARLKAEGYPWDFLLKDMLHAVLKYLAAIGISDYLHTQKEPKFDVNEGLKKLARPMHEGDWLFIVRQCAQHSSQQSVPELGLAFEQIECGRMKVRLTFQKYGLATQRQGLLSALVTARNRLFAHGATLTPEEKQQATPVILALLRAVLHQLGPVWEYGFVQTVGKGLSRQTLLLRGLRAFEPAVIFPDTEGALVKDGSAVLPLHLLVESSAPGRGQVATLVDADSEVYVLNEVARSRMPVYHGVGGGYSERPDLSELLRTLFDKKRVWESRQDIELDEVLDYSRRKLAERLDWASWNNLYDAERFVRRPEADAILRSFLEDSASRALFVAGNSGTGKTSEIIRFLHDRLDDGDPCLFLRAQELETDILKPRVDGGAEARIFGGAARYSPSAA